MDRYVQIGGQVIFAYLMSDTKRDQLIRFIGITM